VVNLKNHKKQPAFERAEKSSKSEKLETKFSLIFTINDSLFLLVFVEIVKTMLKRRETLLSNFRQ